MRPSSSARLRSEGLFTIGSSCTLRLVLTKSRKTALAPERIQNIVTERVGFAFDDLLTCRTVDMNDLRDSFPPFPVSAAPAGLRPVDYSPQTMRRRHRDYRNVLSESAAHVCKKWSLGSG